MDARYYRSAAVCLHRHVPLPVSDSTMGLAPFVAFYTSKAARGDARSVRPHRRILDEDLRDQFCDRRRDRHSDGVSVRHELGRIFAAQRRGGRPAARDGGHVRVLPGVDLSRRAAVRQGVGLPTIAYAWSRCGVRWRRGFRDSSSSRPMRGCSIRSATSLWPTAHPARRASGRCCFRRLRGGSSLTCSAARWLRGRLHRRRHRRVLPALAARDEALGRRFVRAGNDRGLIFSLLAVFPTGDRNGDDVTEYQPVKLAAMEGLFRRRRTARRWRSSGCPTSRRTADRSDLRPGSS